MTTVSSTSSSSAALLLKDINALLQSASTRRNTVLEGCTKRLASLNAVETEVEESEKATTPAFPASAVADGNDEHPPTEPEIETETEMNLRGDDASSSRATFLAKATLKQQELHERILQRATERLAVGFCGRTTQPTLRLDTAIYPSSSSSSSSSNIATNPRNSSTDAHDATATADTDVNASAVSPSGAGEGREKEEEDGEGNLTVRLLPLLAKAINKNINPHHIMDDALHRDIELCVRNYPNCMNCMEGCGDDVIDGGMGGTTTATTTTTTVSSPLRRRGGRSSAAADSAAADADADADAVDGADDGTEEEEEEEESDHHPYDIDDDGNNDVDKLVVVQTTPVEVSVAVHNNGGHNNGGGSGTPTLDITITKTAMSPRPPRRSATSATAAIRPAAVAAAAPGRNKLSPPQPQPHPLPSLSKSGIETSPSPGRGHAAAPSSSSGGDKRRSSPVSNHPSPSYRCTHHGRSDWDDDTHDDDDETSIMPHPPPPPPPGYLLDPPYSPMSSPNPSPEGGDPLPQRPTTTTTTTTTTTNRSGGGGGGCSISPLSSLLSPVPKNLALPQLVSPPAAAPIDPRRGKNIVAAPPLQKQRSDQLHQPKPQPRPQSQQRYQHRPFTQQNSNNGKRIGHHHTPSPPSRRGREARQHASSPPRPNYIGLVDALIHDIESGEVALDSDTDNHFPLMTDDLDHKDSRYIAPRFRAWLQAKGGIRSLASTTLQQLKTTANRCVEVSTSVHRPDGTLLLGRDNYLSIAVTYRRWMREMSTWKAHAEFVAYCVGQALHLSHHSPSSSQYNDENEYDEHAAEAHDGHDQQGQSDPRSNHPLKILNKSIVHRLTPKQGRRGGTRYDTPTSNAARPRSRTSVRQWYHSRRVTEPPPGHLTTAALNQHDAADTKEDSTTRLTVYQQQHNEIVGWYHQVLRAVAAKRGVGKSRSRSRGGRGSY